MLSYFIFDFPRLALEEISLRATQKRFGTTGGTLIGTSDLRQRRSTATAIPKSGARPPGRKKNWPTPAPEPATMPTLQPSPTNNGASPAKPSTGRPQRQQIASRSKSTSSTSSSAAATQQRVPLPTAAAPPTKPAPIVTTLAQRSLPQLSMPPAGTANMNIAISPATPGEMPKISMTSKEWIIPPRPKPGRKPATDTPPTKRKAQNRAAQRAFRERRAARVGELEEQLDMQKEDFDSKEVDFKDKIRSLELDLQSFRSRCMLLENMLDRERQERIRTETEAETLRQRLNDLQFRHQSISSQHGMSQPRDSFASNRLPQPRPSKDLSISNIVAPIESEIHMTAPESTEEHITCGGCSPSSRCACAEQVLSTTGDCAKCGFGVACECLDDMARSTFQNIALKRPSSPSVSRSQEKRRRETETEVDFTAMFSRKAAAESSSQASSMPPSAVLSDMSALDAAAFKESCGFCKDGTYCACADAAMATPAMTPPETLVSVPRQVETPPPSESDVTPTPFIMEMTADGAVKLPPRKKTARVSVAVDAAKPGGCGANGPGTCAQCQADPKSGLFCRLMSAKFSGEGGSGGCCGGKGGAGGGCCKTKKPPVEEKITLPSLPSLGLTCAEAYQTLSSHRNFDKAADDIGSWLPKLKAAQRGPSRAAKQGRMAIEVEAASIMSVLKEFDIRFGREC